MPETTPRKDLSPKLKEEFSDLFHRLCIPQRRRRALDEFLTPDEVHWVIGGQDPKLPGLENCISSERILCVLAECRHWSLERALLELTFSFDMLGPGRFRVLRRAIGEPIETDAPALPNAKPPAVKPRWDRSEGKLWFGNMEIRKVRICSTASRIERILTAFEENSWAISIVEPFGGRLGQGYLHGIVNDLNKRLKGISFHVRGGGREITWEVRPKRSVRVLK